MIKMLKGSLLSYIFHIHMYMVSVLQTQLHGMGWNWQATTMLGREKLLLQEKGLTVGSGLRQVSQC